jgi:hypothetical protein
MNHVGVELVSASGNGMLIYKAFTERKFYLSYRPERTVEKQATAAIKDFITDFKSNPDDCASDERLYEVDRSWVGLWRECSIVEVYVRLLEVRIGKVFVIAKNHEDIARLKLLKDEKEVKDLVAAEEAARHTVALKGWNTLCPVYSDIGALNETVLACPRFEIMTIAARSQQPVLAMILQAYQLLKSELKAVRNESNLETMKFMYELHQSKFHECLRSMERDQVLFGNLNAEMQRELAVFGNNAPGRTDAVEQFRQMNRGFETRTAELKKVAKEYLPAKARVEFLEIAARTWQSAQGTDRELESLFERSCNVEGVPNAKRFKVEDLTDHEQMCVTDES